MLQTTGLNGLSKDVVEVDNMKIDYPDTLALYRLRTSIGLKKYRESCNFRAAKE